MIVKKKPAVYFIASVVLAAVGYLISKKPGLLILCDNQTYGLRRGCFVEYFRIGDPLLYGMSALALIFLVLYFLPKAWDAWKKFALWFVPITAILFIVYPEPESWDIPQEPVFKFISGVYVVVSLLIILYASLRKKD